MTMSKRPCHGITICKLSAHVMLIPLLMLIITTALYGQTLQPVQAVHNTECGSILGIFSSCTTIQTNRISRSFARNNLSGINLFDAPWGVATHCTRADTTRSLCQDGITAVTDASISRIVWSRSNVFIRRYGNWGAGIGQFEDPRGISLSLRNGEWHVAFVADKGNNRVDIIALGYSCQCERWLGSITGIESGTALSGPTDVAWDPTGTYSMSDDRLFILDAGNSRVLVYQININFSGVPVLLSKSYLNSFGSPGAGLGNFSVPYGIAVYTFPNTLRTNVYISDNGNRRVVVWYYDAPAANLPDTNTYAAAQSSAFPGADLEGLTVDGFGDLLVTDYTGQRVLKFKGTGATPLTQLATFGQNPTWAAGNFVYPRDVKANFAYTQNTTTGSLVRTGLAYENTLERWGDTTGIQMHRMGVDANNLSGVPTNAEGATSATISWLFTASGSYIVRIKNTSGTVIRTFPTTVDVSGWKSVFWDGKNDAGAIVTAGTYTVEVLTQSGYAYDAGVMRVASASFSMYTAFTGVSVQGPTTTQPSLDVSYFASNFGGTPPFTYVWKVNGVVKSSSGSSFTYTNNGSSYTVSVTATDKFGIAKTGSLSTTVQQCGGTIAC
jgi:hypothetical protein